MLKMIFQLLTLDKMPVEIMVLILSYLHVTDFLLIDISTIKSATFLVSPSQTTLQSSRPKTGEEGVLAK